MGSGGDSCSLCRKHKSTTDILQASHTAMGVNEIELAKQLDVLMAPLNKFFRYPLPVPSHLALEFSTPLPLPSTAPRGTGTAEVLSSQHHSDPSADAVPLQERIALEECERRVGGLAQWKQQVAEGRQAGEEGQRVLQQLLDGVSEMRTVTAAVQDQSDRLSHDVSVLMVRKVKFERVQAELQATIRHFTRMEDLVRETDDPMLSVTSSRFSELFLELEAEMQFLSRNAQFKSAKTYALKVAMAQENIASKLQAAVENSFHEAKQLTAQSPEYKSAMRPRAERAAAAPDAALALTASPALSVAGADTATGGSSDGGAGALALATQADQPCLDMNDVAGSFSAFLRRVNNAFIGYVSAKASLRRMVELRKGFSHTGAESFGEETYSAVGGVEEDKKLQGILTAYHRARTSLGRPLLQSWLSLWCRADMQGTTGTQLQRQQSDPLNSPLMDGSLGSLTGMMERAGYSLPQLASHVCVLLEVCLEGEKEVMDAVWMREDFVVSLIPHIVSGFTDEVYHVFRSRLLCVNDVTELCATIASVQAVRMREDADVTDGSREMAALWTRMTQDTQERVIFRTSVYLKDQVVRCRPTNDLVMYYAKLDQGDDEAAEGAPATTKAVVPYVGETARIQLLPGVRNAIHLLKLLYPAIEFSVFSVFAEEAVSAALSLSQEAANRITSQQGQDPFRGQACHLAHVLYIQRELSRIDANIMVVERSLDLSQLRRRRLEIVQSSRESKKDVETELVTCSDRLIQAMIATVSQPITGVAHKPTEEVERAVTLMDAALGTCEETLSHYIEQTSIRISLMKPVRQRAEELRAEIATMQAERSKAAQSAQPPPPPQPQAQPVSQESLPDGKTSAVPPPQPPPVMPTVPPLAAAAVAPPPPHTFPPLPTLLVQVQPPPAPSTAESGDIL